MKTHLSRGVLATIAVALVGCGGRSSDPGGGPQGSGGAGGTGGATVNAGGTSGPPSQGAVSIVLNNPDPPATGSGPTCPAVHMATAPIPVAGSVRTTNIEGGTRAVDGVNGNVVSCTVAAAGGPFNVSANISSTLGAQSVTVTIGPLTIAQGQLDATGGLAVQDDVTQYQYMSRTAEPCIFSVVGGSMGIGSGKIWGSVTCAKLVDPGSAAGDACKATGYFIFENCGW